MTSKLNVNEHIAALLDSCPTEPGVYLMKNEDSAIIYVGKAKNLRSRVRSYFQNLEQAGAKTQHLVSHIADMEFLRTRTEVEALLLENTLIKKHKPKYNIRLKDDKSYPYLKLDLTHDFPRPSLARRQTKSDAAEFFGPFPHGSAVWKLLKISAKVFQLRDCRDHEFANRSRPCLSHEIGQCTAPCVKLVSRDEYKEQVNDFKMFLKGQNDELEVKWSKEMLQASENMEFEKAAELRDRIQLMHDVLGDEQSVVDTGDLSDRDVWAVWPERFANAKRLEAESSWEEGEAIDCMVLQFREGKLAGRLHWGGDLTEAFEAYETLASVLVRHYSKNEAPSAIVIPPDSTSIDRGALAEALITDQVDKAEVPVLDFADAREGWAAAYALARDNVKGWYEERREQRQKDSDTIGKLQRFLSLPRKPLRMECIDISNFQGEGNVASCVVFKGGKPSKDDYRKYKIKTVEGQDDFGSMKEVVSRRYLKPGVVLPDLLVVDGGRGQLSSVVQVLEEFALEIPVLSLAKARVESDFKSSEVKSSEERIFLPGQKNEKKLREPAVRKLLTHIRDEAHRFAINFNRQQMRKRLANSALTGDD